MQKSLQLPNCLGITHGSTSANTTLPSPKLSVSGTAARHGVPSRIAKLMQRRHISASVEIVRTTLHSVCHMSQNFECMKKPELSSVQSSSSTHQPQDHNALARAHQLTMLVSKLLMHWQSAPGLSALIMRCSFLELPEFLLTSC